MNVPKETDEWFEKMVTYFERCCQLYKQGDSSNAIIGFQILYSLLDKLDDEIVFADKLGTWMMGGDTKKYSLHYIQAASETCDDESFAKHMLPVLREDSYSSFCDKVFNNIKSHSSKSQVDCVKKLAKKEGVRLTSK